MSNYTVYIHTNTANGMKYVGITSKRPEERWQGGHGYRKQAVFWNAIVKYGWDNFTHEIVATGLTDEAAWKLEQALISKYDTTNRKHGYNRSVGGECGAKGVGRSEKNKKATSAALKRLWSDEAFKERRKAATREMNKSPEIRKKRSESQKGRTLSEETRRKISEAKTGVQIGPFTEEHKRRMKENHGGGAEKKPVLCVETGEVFSCIKEAANQTGINKKQISNCCRGVPHYNTAGGYTWRFAKVG